MAAGGRPDTDVPRALTLSHPERGTVLRSSASFGTLEDWHACIFFWGDRLVRRNSVLGVHVDPGELRDGDGHSGRRVRGRPVRRQRHGVSGRRCCRRCAKCRVRVRRGVRLRRELHDARRFVSRHGGRHTLHRRSLLRRHVRSLHDSSERVPGVQRRGVHGQLQCGLQGVRRRGCHDVRGHGDRSIQLWSLRPAVRLGHLQRWLLSANHGACRVSTRNGPIADL